MDITLFQLSNPWRYGQAWTVPEIPRRVTRAVLNWMEEPEILVLTGARQTGKTSVLYQLIDHLLRREDVRPEDISFFSLDLQGTDFLLEDQGRFLRFLAPLDGPRKYVFIDEVQRMADPGRFVKGIHDQRLPLKFILTGSSTLELRAKTGEPLTGRKQIFPVTPLTFGEYVRTLPFGGTVPPALDASTAGPWLEPLNEALDTYAVYGGYPAVVQTRDPLRKRERLNEIFTSYLEKDIAGFLRVENLPAFRRLTTCLAAQAGSLVNVHELSNTLGIHQETVRRYLHDLESTFIVSRLHPWCVNPRTELSKSPKIYFSDSGIRNCVLGVYTPPANRPDGGAVVEGIVAAHLLHRGNRLGRVNFWRTQSGAEVDFVLSSDKAEHAVEVKTGKPRSLKVERGFRSFLEKYAPPRATVLNRSVWGSADIAGHRVEFVPTAAFLLQEMDTHVFQ